MYLRKDAAASSQIEGTQATMMDAIEAAAHVSESLPADVDDILHYINALNYGMKRVAEENFPVSLRFIRELHEVLMGQARSTHFSDPGLRSTSGKRGFLKNQFYSYPRFSKNINSSIMKN